VGKVVKIVVTIRGDIKANMAGLYDRWSKAITAAVNMIGSMLLSEMRSDIAGSGNFGERWTDGLKLNTTGAAPNFRLAFTHDIDYAGIFEKGGVIQGQPLLWIPLSGTDAAGIRASAFGGLVSSRNQRKDGGRPLLFAISDKLPRYFGIESVTIPQKWHLNEDIESVMGNFRSVFEDAWAGA